MKQQAMIAQMRGGGYIQNNLFVNADGTPRKGKIQQRQITALVNKGLVSKTVGYDLTHTYRVIAHD